jgi:hypothetical protein
VPHQQAQIAAVHESRPGMQTETENVRLSGKTGSDWRTAKTALFDPHRTRKWIIDERVDTIVSHFCRVQMTLLKDTDEQ